MELNLFNGTLREVIQHFEMLAGQHGESVKVSGTYELDALSLWLEQPSEVNLIPGLDPESWVIPKEGPEPDKLQSYQNSIERKGSDPSSSIKRECSYCRKEVSKDAYMCGRCGSIL